MLELLIVAVGFALLIHEERRVRRLRAWCDAKNRENREKFEATKDWRHLAAHWVVR